MTAAGLEFDSENAREVFEDVVIGLTQVIGNIGMTFVERFL